LVVASTAFVGVSIYAQTDDSELTTFEEEELSSENATNATDDGSTSTAADLSFLDGLVVCSVGSSEVTGETQTAADISTEGTPTVSVTVMSETEVAELAANETETAAETSTASASCLEFGGSTSASSDESGANTTSTASSNDTSAATSSNMTGADNATSTESNATASSTASTASTSSDREILVIQGQDFAPGQAVLMFTENALVGIDDVDDNGEIEAKIPMPGGETAIAGNETSSTELRFLETGTQRTATFAFDGQTLTASEGGDIAAEGSEDSATSMPAPSDNATSTTNSTLTTNSTNSTMQ
jgi:hypothetical protein